MEFERAAGVLMHITSLPGKHGIGTLGKEALEFVDFLAETRQKLWQTFPLGPTGYGDSPYQCFSAFAGNPWLISLEELVNDGLLTHKALETKTEFSDTRVYYWSAIQFKAPLLEKAFHNFMDIAADYPDAQNEFNEFCHNNALWLDDFALFMAVKEHHQGKSWAEWLRPLKMREPKALEKISTILSERIQFQKFLQYQFFKQWHKVKSYANERGIKVIGDIPIFVAFDSADAWANPELFFFDEERNPTKIAGVPPDYFSETGQLWGNPLYNWEKNKETGYQWWISRIKSALSTCDMMRIDHFRGFAAYWAVPCGESTAINGTWEPGPGLDLFIAIENALGKLPIIAEDLGVITPDVVAIREGAKLPGMKILQFAFDAGEANDYLPHTYLPNSVVYTGTHDNDTTLGWFQKAKEEEREYVLRYMHGKEETVTWDFIRTAYASVSCMAIVPMQDILALGTEARMNTPGIASGNWQWRMEKGQIGHRAKEKLRSITETYGR